MAEFRYGCLLAMGITAAAVAAPASASLVSVLNNGGFESTFRNVHQEQYQRGGFAWQLGAGMEMQ